MHLRQVDLGHTRRRAKECFGEATIVGREEHAAGVIVESTHRKKPLGHSLEDIPER